MAATTSAYDYLFDLDKTERAQHRKYTAKRYACQMANANGFTEKQIDLICDIIESKLSSYEDVMDYVERRPIGFC